MDNKIRIIMLIDHWMDTNEESDVLADRIINQVDVSELNNDKPRFRMDAEGNLTRI